MPSSSSDDELEFNENDRQLLLDNFECSSMIGKKILLSSITNCSIHLIKIFNALKGDVHSPPHQWDVSSISSSDEEIQSISLSVTSGSDVEFITQVS